jgi:hypothetical protein
MADRQGRPVAWAAAAGTGRGGTVARRLAGGVAPLGRPASARCWAARTPAHSRHRARLPHRRPRRGSRRRARPGGAPRVARDGAASIPMPPTRSSPSPTNGRGGGAQSRLGPLRGPPVEEAPAIRCARSRCRRPRAHRARRHRARLRQRGGGARAVAGQRRHPHRGGRRPHRAHLHPQLRDRARALAIILGLRCTSRAAG